MDAKPVGVCAADFDGDGTNDLAVTFLTPGGSIVWRGSASGLGREGLLRPCGDYPLPPLALPRGSFGASGKAAQLALCSRSTKVLEIASPFSTGAPAPITLEHVPRAMASGIVQGHAWLAIACDDKRLEVLREGGASPEPWSISGLYPRCALISEELSAVLVGFQDSESIEAYASPSAAPIGKLELGGMPRDMAVIDIDSDGDLELVVAGGKHELWIFGLSKPGGARAWFETGAPAVWQAGAIPLQLAVADFDADTKPDLAVLHHYDLSVRLLTKLSTAGPGVTSSLYAGQTPVGFAAFEGDGDARMDIVVANRDTKGLGILPGDGAGALIAGTSVALGKFPNALAATSAGQVKQGGLRLVALNSKSNDVSAVVLEAGKLRGLAGVACGGEPHAPQIAELDGKSGLDVLLLGTGPRGAQLLMMRGDAAGKLESPAVLELGGAASDLALIDVDQDGKLELAICDPAAASVKLCESAAARCESLGLNAAASLEVPSAPCALAAIELDGDAASELACVLGAPGERVGVAWLEPRRGGDGKLALTELGFTPLRGAPIDAVASDLNADGRIDLAVRVLDGPTTPGGTWFAMLRGPGGPADFWVSPAILTGSRPHRIAAADLDGDGRAEIFVAAQDSHLVNAWTPTGAASARAFDAKPWDDLGAGRGPLDLALCDVDGDGVLDLCVVNGFSDDLSVLHGRAGVKAK